MLWLATFRVPPWLMLSGILPSITVWGVIKILRDNILPQARATFGSNFVSHYLKDQSLVPRDAIIFTDQLVGIVSNPSLSPDLTCMELMSFWIWGMKDPLSFVAELPWHSLHMVSNYRQLGFTPIRVAAKWQHTTEWWNCSQSDWWSICGSVAWICCQ